MNNLFGFEQFQANAKNDATEIERIESTVIRLSWRIERETILETEECEYRANSKDLKIFKKSDSATEGFS